MKGNKTMCPQTKQYALTSLSFIFLVILVVI